MFKQPFENELWNIWSNRSISVLLVMQPVLTITHKTLCEEYKTNEMKINLIIKSFNNVIKKSHFSIETSDSFNNTVNLIFNLASINPTTRPITIKEFLEPLNGNSLACFLKQSSSYTYFQKKLEI